jgi:ribosomal protein S18 acetylase RimI-like enzyme
MTSADNVPPVELRAQAAADAAFVDRLVRDHLNDALGMAQGFDPGPLVDLQLRSRAVMLEQTYPALQRRVAWVGAAPAGSLLTAELDGALHVVEILTASEWRRRGVAASVLAQAVAEAGARHQDVTARIFTTNTASLALFASLGFTLDTPPSAAQAFARLRTCTGVT